MKRIVKWKNKSNEVVITGKVYYLNTLTGSDTDDGLSTDKAWKTTSYAQSTIANGDVVLTEPEGSGPRATIPSAPKSEYAVYKMNDSVVTKQIIADHTIVADYANIPQAYIDIVKTWLVNIAGESHSAAYRSGCDALEAADGTYQVTTFDNTNDTFPGTSSSYLRLGRGASTGEGEFWTNTTAIAQIKSVVAAQHNASNPIHVFGFGWCWDMVWGTPAASADPVYGCHWQGKSLLGPDGDLCWGLDAADEALTGNSVCLDTYLDAIEEYNAYCETNGYACKFIFTTGPCDEVNEGGYQGEVKHNYIRDFVAADSGRILFDYADILCHDADGTPATTTWNGHTYNTITETNLGEGETGHISAAGALRLAKAMWWMLARMAGWDGN